MSTFSDNKNDTGKLIHVGAGSGIDIHGYLQKCYTDIVLLEPVPKVFKQLNSKIEKLNKTDIASNLSVFNLALSISDVHKVDNSFKVTQPSRYSGFQDATKLKQIFQNLKTLETITVDLISFSNLIKKTSLDKTKNNSLVLQVNGSELDLIEHSSTTDLMLFTNIVIQQANNDYFKQNKESRNLISLMDDKGFQLVSEVSNDAIYSVLTFKKDEVALELESFDKIIKEQASRISELEKKINQSDDALVASVDESNRLAERIQNKATRITQLEEQLATVKASKEKEADKSSEQIQNKATLITQLEEQVQDKVLRIQGLESELLEKSRSGVLSQQMLAKAQTDLDSLRKSYSEKFSSEKELVDLVKELRDKLLVASKYYQELQKEHPELLLSAEKAMRD